MSVKISGASINSVSMGHVPASFNPVTFWSGYNGGFWDFTNPANLFADTALTVPATLNAVGGVWGVTDLSGLGHKLTRDTGGGGTSFTMRSGYCESNFGALDTVAISIGNVYTYIALFRPTAIGSLQNLVDSDYGISNRVAQALIITTTGHMQSYIFGYSSPSIIMPSPTLSTGVDYFTAAAVNNTSEDLSVAGTTYTAGGGTLVGGLAPVAVGASFGGTLTPQYQQFTGRIYCAAMITKKCTALEIQDIGNYMNSLAGTSAVV